jgi:hypothetical protein
MFDKRFRNIVQSKYIIKLRDTLLPHLLSGELRFFEAEKFIAEANV